jgi:hypothetical protein
MLHGHIFFFLLHLVTLKRFLIADIQAVYIFYTERKLSH